MIDYSKCPAQHMASGMKRYIEQGISPGSFMESVLCNDLKGAVMRADSINVNLLKEWLWWLMEFAPAECWGSPMAFETWIIKHVMPKPMEEVANDS